MNWEVLDRMSTRGRMLALFLGITLLLTSGASAQALVQNGDFSVDFTGNLANGQWVANANAFWDNSVPANPVGTFNSTVALGAATLSQTGASNLIAGHIYQLAFALSNLSGLGTSTFTVTYNGATVFSQSGPTAGNKTALISTFAPASLDGPLVFTFTKTAGGGVGAVSLDDVTLTDLGVPEIDPASATTPLCLAFGSLIVVGERRRRKSTTV